MKQTTPRFMEAARGFSGQERDPVRIWESGIRWAVARRTGRGADREQDRRMRFAEEEQAKESRAQRTDMQDVMNGLEEVRTGRGSAGLARGSERDQRKRERKMVRGTKRIWRKGRQKSQRISAEREDVEGEEEQEADDDEVEKEKVRSEDEC